MTQRARCPRLFGVAGAAALALVACAHHPPASVRTSRPAAGTIVGVTLRTPAPAAVEAAFAAIEAGEAALSEWRPTSRAAALARGEALTLAPDEQRVFALAEAARVASGGAFDVCWKGGRLVVGPPTRAEGCAGLDLGGVLKGWLADRAAAALLAGGVEHFVVDVAGDVVAHGHAGDGEPGWPVVAVVGATAHHVRLRDQALSTASGDQQPGHIRDARTGQAAGALAGVFVVAPTGLEADTWDTACFAAGRPLALPPGVEATAVPLPP